MNIFILDQNPVKAAQLQCDKHVVKMIVESGQMLSTVHRMVDGKMERRPSKSGSMLQYYKHPNAHLERTLYKACHYNHPSTVWTRESIQNYIWHYDHFYALCLEYTYRYGKIHATQTKLDEVLSIPPTNIPHIGLTPFKLAMAAFPQCIVEDPVQSYRNFYQTKQERFKMVWTDRPVPEWFNELRSA